MLPVINAMYSAELAADANAICLQMAEEYDQILSWLDDLRRDGFYEQREFNMGLSIIGYLAQQLLDNGAEDAAEKVADIYTKYAVMMQ
jgi:hypothetical protein